MMLSYYSFCSEVKVICFGVEDFCSSIKFFICWGFSIVVIVIGLVVSRLFSPYRCTLLFLSIDELVFWMVFILERVV